MINRSIMKHLGKILDRPNPERKFSLFELHLLIVTFLKRLSIFAENKQDMVRMSCFALCFLNALGLAWWLLVCVFKMSFG